MLCIILCVLLASCHLILTINLWGRNYYFPHFTYKELRQRGETKQKHDLSMIIWLPEPKLFTIHGNHKSKKLQVSSKEWQCGERPVDWPLHPLQPTKKKKKKKHMLCPKTATNPQLQPSITTMWEHRANIIDFIFQLRTLRLREK